MSQGNNNPTDNYPLPKDFNILSAENLRDLDTDLIYGVIILNKPEIYSCTFSDDAGLWGEYEALTEEYWETLAISKFRLSVNLIEDGDQVFVSDITSTAHLTPYELTKFIRNYLSPEVISPTGTRVVSLSYPMKPSHVVSNFNDQYIVTETLYSDAGQLYFLDKTDKYAGTSAQIHHKGTRKDLDSFQYDTYGVEIWIDGFWDAKFYPRIEKAAVKALLNLNPRIIPESISVDVIGLNNGEVIRSEVIFRDDIFPGKEG